jgi:uncharacterized protein (TIGR00106 family)
MATAELTILPMGREGASVGDLLALVAERLAAQDAVEFEIGPMGTSLEGGVTEILDLVGELQEIPLAAGLPRVYTVLKLDNRADRKQSLGEKVESMTRDRA